MEYIAQKSVERLGVEKLMPEDYDKVLMKKTFLDGAKNDPFKLLGVSQEDKMSFFLLKWVFNAIKIDSAGEDPKLPSKPFVKKGEMIK